MFSGGTVELWICMLCLNSLAIMTSHDSLNDPVTDCQSSDIYFDGGWVVVGLQACFL